MKKYNHPDDDFFREALGDYKMVPSDAARKAFLRDAMQSLPPAKKFRKGLIALSVLLLMSTAGIISWSVLRNDPAPSLPVKPAGQNIKTSFSSGKMSPEKAIASPCRTSPVKNVVATPSLNGTSAKANQVKPENNSRISEKSFNSSHPVTPGHPGEVQPSGPGNQPQPASIASTTFIADAKTSGSTLADASQGDISTTAAPAAITGVHPAEQPVQESPREATLPADNEQPASAGQAGLNGNPDTLFLPGRHGSNPDFNSRRNPMAGQISIGISYTPEWMFNTLEGTKFVNNFGIEGTYHFGRFSIRTGAGLSIAKGAHELVVEYNDFLGAYNKLDSIGFIWNEPVHNYTTKMYLSPQEVFDSIMKLDYAKVVKRYTYLQVPMIMGYDFWQSDRISMGIRTGPIMSVLIATKQLSAAYDPGTKRIISMNDIAPEQISLNWQVMAGINTSIRLTRELNFEVEPSVRYYFNSIYEKPVNNTKPWSISLRAAFVVKF